MFFLINLIMGLTPMRIWPFFWVSQVGMLPATIIYVNAGVEIAQINSIESILSYKLIMALTLIGLLPLIGNSIIKIEPFPTSDSTLITPPNLLIICFEI